MSELTDERLAEIRARHTTYREAFEERLNAPLTSTDKVRDTAIFSAGDVPDLLAEVERLKGELAEERRTGSNAVGMLAIAAKDIDQLRAPAWQDADADDAANCREVTRLVLEAAAPVIAAAVREQIAREIEAHREYLKDETALAPRHARPYTEMAARVRGQKEQA